MPKVLFIDDQVETLQPLLKLVGNLLPDIDILTANNGPEGLARMREEQPDMVFLDIGMPKMNGFEVCHTAQQDAEIAHIPVLFLSSLELSMKEQLQALDAGASDFLRKPIQAVELATRIRATRRLNEYTQRLEELVEIQTMKIERQHKIASRTERLAAMGTLAAGIAHEINQPLNALKVTADGLLYWKERNQTISEEEIFDGLRFISRQCNRIDDIIRHMRDLAQQNPVKELKPVDLRVPVRQAMALIGVQIRHHGIELVTEFQDNLPPALGSETPLEQILLNLVNNAVRALDSSDQPTKTIRIATFRDGDRVALSICDNGPGIPSDALESIFDPFFSMDETGYGMGLGLSITQNLAASLRGTLTVQNGEEGGACFILALETAPEQV